MGDKTKGPYHCPNHGYTNFVHKGKLGSYMICPLCKINELEEQLMKREQGRCCMDARNNKERNKMEMTEKEMQEELTRRKNERLKKGPPEDPGPCPEDICIQTNILECADWFNRAIAYQTYQASQNTSWEYKAPEGVAKKKPERKE